MARKAAKKEASDIPGTGRLKPLLGYPVKKPFTAIDDIEAYLDGETVLCLLCGRQYTALGGHLGAVHQLSSDDYKIRFGIPLRYGLASKPFRQASARRMKRQKREGNLPVKPSKATIQKMLKARLNRRPVSEATRRQSREKLRRIHGRERLWQPEDFYEFFRRIKSGRTVLEVENDKDMPTRHALLLYLKKDAVLKDRYKKVWETLPFAVQVRANKTGERYRRTLVRLRAAGKTWKQVAQAMGVKPSSVCNMWHILKRSGKLKKYLRQAKAA